MIRYILSWFLLLIFAFLNAAVRELTYKSVFGEFLSHQISVFTGILFLAIPIWFIARYLPFRNASQAIKVGILWVILTETFEFLMVVVSMKRSFQEFLHAHNLLAGQFWIIILVWVGIAPYLFYRLRSR
ncbi:hypothetical protein LEP1GSC047_2495 [Leptospira inadai serovar Lyme str. 10]|uniref:Uncharacterized protein n=2 Tax=Leptospira inadai serovar Lyme TaxID=293084 RepID=V6HBJ9_9LEPT|nr:hypothetical protein [Leptospira inadai]EQA36817.1 hypothetical protein LEP1GSC047_2495 [Leptospira inadai serovar Lyme str. 10]PNV75676.1 hypothetical protein BES34_006425 [Leptospira inadai serovar Lyme]